MYAPAVTNYCTHRLWSAVAAFSFSFLFAFSSSAESNQARAGARATAQDGIVAYNEGRYEEALSLIERAESIVHAPTHLLFIARSHAQLGKLIDAREAYQLIMKENLAPDAPQAFLDAQQSASVELPEIDGRIAKLTIQIKAADGEELQGLAINIDGEPLPSALLGLAVPVDPGRRVISVVATGMEPVRQELVLPEGAEETVVVQLKKGSSKGERPQAEESEAKDAARHRRSRKKWAWVSMGSGAGVFAAGAILGALSMSQLNSAACDQDRACTPDGMVDVNAAQTKALVADITMGVGIAAIGVGVILLLTNKKRGPEKVGLQHWVPGVSRDGGFLAYEGRF